MRWDDKIFDEITWPREPKGFGSALLSAAKALQELGDRLVEVMCGSARVSESMLDAWCYKRVQGAGDLLYPEHIDPGLFTFGPLPRGEGLQIKQPCKDSPQVSHWVALSNISKGCELLIFANASLQQHVPNAMPLVHRVVDQGEPRLTMLYNVG